MDILPRLAFEFRLVFIGILMVDTIVKVQIVISFIFTVDRSGFLPKLYRVSVHHVLSLFLII